jgi:hypothetical protein
MKALKMTLCAIGFFVLLGLAGAMEFEDEIAHEQAKCERQGGVWIAEPKKYYCQLGERK